MHVRRLAWMWLIVGRRLAWVWLVVGRLLVRLWGWVWILVLGWRLRTRDCVALLLRVARLTVAALHRTCTSHVRRVHVARRRRRPGAACTSGVDAREPRQTARANCTRGSERGQFSQLTTTWHVKAQHSASQLACISLSVSW